MEVQEEELEKLKKRAERFGSSVSPAITSVSQLVYDTVVLLGMAHTLQVEEDEKKKRRMERFGLTATEMSVQVRIVVAICTLTD